MTPAQAVCRDPAALGRPRALPAPAAAVVAIPARNEAERIGACLAALARQTRPPEAVVLLLNNCTDGTELVARRVARGLRFPLHVIHHRFPGATASAGQARRLAMQYAAILAGPHGVLLSTDADSVAAGDWIERSLRALSAGAAAVCGRIQVDPIEAAAIPARLQEDDALEGELIGLLDRIADRLDPDPVDPWPRHTEAAGASIAVTAAAYDRAGGMPAVPYGEDRAFIAALSRLDMPIRHDPEIRVTVSARTIGRAAGGMADTIRRRMQQQDEFTDDAVEPAGDAYRRYDFRRRLRRAWCDVRLGFPLDEDLPHDLGLVSIRLRDMLHSPSFGLAWERVQAASPFLLRRRVRFAELPKQIALARHLLADASGGTGAGRSLDLLGSP